MKLAHVAICTPGRCGLYETARELVAAERALGYDARMVDPRPTQFYPGEGDERGALIAGKEFVNEADVILDHSGCDGTTDSIDKPHILVAHGRPESSFLSEKSGGAPVYSYHYRLDGTAKYRGVVTFWRQHVGALEVMFRQTPVRCVPPPVDLQAWHPDGARHDFGGKAGVLNAVITDAWRDDVDPFHAVNAVALAARQIPGLRLHIYGKQGGDKGWPALLKRLGDDGTIGQVQGWTKGLANVYRAADLLVTPHRILTRTVRESMACGLQHVVCSGESAGVDAGSVVAALQSPTSRQQVRQQAEAVLNPLNTAKMFLAAVEQMCGN